MAQINKPTDYFGTLLYTGNDTNDRDITGLNFTPSLTWIKPRSSAGNHGLFDAVRGADKSIRANETRAEDTSPSNKDLDSFISGGIRVDQSNYIDTNTDGISTVAWNWKANGSGSANTDGSISSTVSASTTSGFSIVSYTGNATVSTIGHGLGVAPKMIITKRRTGGTEAWPVDCRQVDGIMYLNETGAKGSYGDSSPYPSTAPTSTVYSIGTPGNTNFNGADFISYCFAEKKGFSKFGSYTGNGNADGTFVYTGMKPSFVMVKETGNTNSWRILDNKRDTFNVMTQSLYANLSNAEGSSGHNTDFLSNGFKIRDSDTSMNRSGGNFIYMCFASEPLVGTNNIPATAR